MSAAGVPSNGSSFLRRNCPLKHRRGTEIELLLMRGRRGFLSQPGGRKVLISPDLLLPGARRRSGLLLDPSLHALLQQIERHRSSV